MPASPARCARTSRSRAWTTSGRWPRLPTPATGSSACLVSSPDVIPLHRREATAIARAVAAREVSAEEVATAHLDRIAALDEPLGAYLHVTRERALQSARRVDAALSAGERLPLAGVPVAVKDILHV